jgi:hypothetical protein
MSMVPRTVTPQLRNFAEIPSRLACVRDVHGCQFTCTNQPSKPARLIEAPTVVFEAAAPRQYQISPATRAFDFKVSYPAIRLVRWARCGRSDPHAGMFRIRFLLPLMRLVRIPPHRVEIAFPFVLSPTSLRSSVCCQLQSRQVREKPPRPLAFECENQFGASGIAANLSSTYWSA